MGLFELFDAVPVLARYIAMIPGIIVPALVALAGSLCLFVIVDRLVDAGSAGKAQ